MQPGPTYYRSPSAVQKSDLGVLQARLSFVADNTSRASCSNRRQNYVQNVTADVSEPQPLTPLSHAWDLDQGLRQVTNYFYLQHMQYPREFSRVQKAARSRHLPCIHRKSLHLLGAGP